MLCGSFAWTARRPGKAGSGLRPLEFEAEGFIWTAKILLRARHKDTHAKKMFETLRLLRPKRPDSCHCARALIKRFKVKHVEL